jgi:hypothetical protein
MGTPEGHVKGTRAFMPDGGQLPTPLGKLGVAGPRQKGAVPARPVYVRSWEKLPFRRPNPAIALLMSDLARNPPLGADDAMTRSFRHKRS